MTTEVSPYQQRWAWCKTKTIGELEEIIKLHDSGWTIDLEEFGQGHLQSDIIQAAQYCVTQYIEEQAEVEAKRAYLASCGLEGEDEFSTEVLEALDYYESHVRGKPITQQEADAALDAWGDGFDRGD